MLKFAVHSNLAEQYYYIVDREGPFWGFFDLPVFLDLLYLAWAAFLLLGLDSR